MRFSIIIPTYKRQDALSLCLNGVEHYFQPGAQARLGHQVEVIVSDDAHEASVQSFLARRYPWCHYVQGPRRGPAANRNHGAQNASGEWIVFTDDDCLPQPGWIEAYAALADQYDVMEGRTSAEGSRTRIDEECPINETGGFLWSCNFAIRRDIFLTMGGFNEDFPAAAMEDVELNQRIKQADLRCIFLPEANVTHPWRKRKGRKFLKIKAESVAMYVCLHPEKASYFSTRSQIVKVLRSIKSNLILSASSGILRGLHRQLLLDTYAALSVWQAVSRSRRGSMSRSLLP